MPGTGPTMNRPSGENAGNPRKTSRTPVSATAGTKAAKSRANPDRTSQSGRTASGCPTATWRGSRLSPSASQPPHKIPGPSART